MLKFLSSPTAKNKLLKAIMVAVFVSLASQIRVHFIAEGFIVSLSVLIMAIFIYTLEDLSAFSIAALSGIFSPFLRFMVEASQTGDWLHCFLLVIPDAIFFFTYGIVYTLIYRNLILAPKTMRNFSPAVFAADFLGNVAELSARSLIGHMILLTPENLSLLMIIAAARTAILMMIVVSIESYSRFLVNKEHEDEYKRLLLTASKIEGEMHVMEKNKSEVEAVTKKAYVLYNKLKEAGYPQDIVSGTLEIARNTHEIKGDYQNVLGVLNEVYLSDLENNSLTLNEVIDLERANVQTMFRNRGADLRITYRGDIPYHAKNFFKMMSVIRNLLTNAAEAIGDKPGIIQITAAMAKENIVIHVRDNGPGIEPDDLETIFLDGYSTKFDETGNIMRGLGLSLVKDYVENIFDGSISISSNPGEYTDFCLTIPKTAILEDENEVLRT